MSFAVTPSTPLPEIARFHGARMRKTGAQELATATEATVVFEATDLDSDAFADLADDSFTLPTGVRFLRARCGVGFEAGTGDRQVLLWVEGAPVSAGIHVRQPATVGGVTWIYGASGVLAVVPGDVLRLRAWQDSGGGLDVLAGSWLEIEIVKTPVLR